MPVKLKKKITFLAILRCASEFLKMLPKFKMAATGQLHNFCGNKNIKSEIILILQSHCQQYGDFFQNFTEIQVAAID